MEQRKHRFTISHAAEGEGKFIREVNGTPHHGHVIVRMEPNGLGQGILISYDAPVGSIPEDCIKPTMDAVYLILEEDGVEGGSLTDIIVHIVGGSSHPTHSTWSAYQMAAAFAVKDAVKKAGFFEVD